MVTALSLVAVGDFGGATSTSRARALAEPLQKLGREGYA
jgi:hypothetical protein